jgi:hypothetical protein
MTASSIQVCNSLASYVWNTDHKKVTGKKFTSVALGSSKDVDIAVDAAKKVGVHHRRYRQLEYLTPAKGIQNILGFEMPWCTAGKAVVQTGGVN